MTVFSGFVVDGAGEKAMRTFCDFLNKRMEDNFFRCEYESIQPEVDIIRAIVEARQLKHITKKSYLAFCIFGMVLFLMHPSSTLAAVNNLDDNPNYPATYYHANYREYVDLSSCAWDDALDDYDVYSTGYIALTFTPEGESRRYLTRSFRQVKDGSEPPQFYNAHTQEWITIPVYDRNEIRQYKQDNGYLGYIEHYHAYAYFMFKAVYKETRGVEYPDNLEGEIP